MGILSTVPYFCNIELILLKSIIPPLLYDKITYLALVFLIKSLNVIDKLPVILPEPLALDSNQRPRVLN